jgi:hypothetical protein
MEKVIKWNNLELLVKDFKHSHANGGRLNKFWVQDRKSGRIFLIKSCGNFSYEPFSEKIASIIGRSLGIDVLDYDIIPVKLFKGIIDITNPFCRYVSICEKIDRKGYSITSIAEIKRARNALLEKGKKPVTNKEVMYEVLDRNYIDTMFLFDAIIGNVDRHYGNVHVLRDTDGKLIGAPILDNGASILANTPAMIARLAGYKVGERFNKSFTTAKNHDIQMCDAISLSNISFNIPTKTMEILDEIQPTLDLMPKLRAKVIKQYLVYRLHKYLGMIKYSDNIKYLNSRNKHANFKRENEISGC